MNAHGAKDGVVGPGRRLPGRYLWGAAATAVALLSCYGVTALVTLLSLAGLSLSVREGPWAATIAAAAVLAVAATALNLPRHGRVWPLLAAGAGAAFIVYAMFGAYHAAIEALGFLLLVGAVIADLRLLRTGARGEKQD